MEDENKDSKPLDDSGTAEESATGDAAENEPEATENTDAEQPAGENEVIGDDDEKPDASNGAEEESVPVADDDEKPDASNGAEEVAEEPAGTGEDVGASETEAEKSETDAEKDAEKPIDTEVEDATGDVPAEEDGDEVSKSDDTKTAEAKNESEEVKEESPEDAKPDAKTDEEDAKPDDKKDEEDDTEKPADADGGGATDDKDERESPEEGRETAQSKSEGLTADEDDEEEEDGKGKKAPAKAAEEGAENEDEEEENVMPDDFFYNLDDYVSKPAIEEESGLPADLLSLHHSFGYDCTKRSNLHLLDENTVCFVAGNYLEMLNLKTKQQTYIRSSSGGGLGALAVHPSRKYFAVAEKGNTPTINVFEYPSLKLFRILRGGTERAYSYVDFSPDGKLLASVGSDPDYMLTLWNWKNEKIVLRSKAFSQDVFRVTFSGELEGQLTSSGIGHIRFWKMAKTFTGLKLQGEIGKFGKTEISDIEGYVELPDGKVLSGSEWGNMLLWDGGLIKVEIARKGRKLCHNGSIQQIVMDEGELMTVGSDGCIRVWDFESIDTADVTDESGVFEMEPMNELQIGDGDVKLKSMIKSFADQTIWLAQDANGGVWKLDLSFSHTSSAPEKIVSYHASSITACDASPISHIVATTGIDKTVRIYDYLSKNQLCESKYTSGGSSILWAPKVVDPKGSTVLSGFEDGVVRIFRFQSRYDLDPGKRYKDNSELVLFQAFKPHNKKVSCLAIDHQGELLATGSEDCTVFFLQCGTAQEEFYDPIGYIDVPAPVTHLQWTPSSFEKNALLVFMSNGQVLEVEALQPGNYDTSHTYHITGHKTKLYTFKSVKSTLRHEEEMERKRKEEEERKKKEEEEKKKRRERGLEDEDEDKDKEVEKAPTEEWSPYIPPEPSPILYGFYSNEEDKFWVSMGDFDAGYLYECKLVSEEERLAIPENKRDEPVRAIPIPASDDIPITNIKISGKQKSALMGLEDGSVRVQRIENPDDISTMAAHWSLPMHDNHYGRINSVCISFDEKYLFTVGDDGNFFVYNVMEQEELDEKIADNKARLPSAKKVEDMKRTDDIEDPSAYSIEDAKQKAEYDKMMKLAEEKKQSVRQTIARLRMQFKSLLQKNDELPSHLKIGKKEFEMDPEIKKELRKHTDEKIDLVRKELAWEAEKHRIALEKLKQKFKDVVECERIIVKCFLTKHEVQSFRASKLSDDFYQLKAEMERRRTTMSNRDELSRDPTSLLKGRNKIQDGGGQDGDGDEVDGLQTKTTIKGSMGERINKALAKVEEKKRKRAQRRSQWDDLNTSKPDDNYEDPADVAAIKEAQENMGDYKLKTAGDYVVPDHLRMNAEKARNRLLVLKDLIHQHKYDFNQKLLTIRDKKINIIEEIKDIVVKLNAVQEKLNPQHHKPLPEIPEMTLDELPEKKMEYTKDQLLQFKKDLVEKQLKDIKGNTESGFGGGGSFTGAKATTPQSRQRDRNAIDEEPKEEEEDVQVSPLEQQLKRAEEIRLIYERDRLLNRVEFLLKTFDAELRLLRHDKFKLDIDMKNADLRHVTLFEELVLLKEFEKRENVLAEKVESKETEKLDMQSKVIDCQQKLDLKGKDIAKLLDKEKALQATFISSLGENNKFVDFLTKVFRKKIKRTKKKATENESDDESDEDSDDDSDFSDDDEDDESEAGGLDLDVCPAGCDQAIYDNTCQLREKRLDIEEAMAEEKKLNDTLKKELENLQKKEKIIQGALRTAENELEAFQLEKQQKLNELDVVVTLKLNQVQHIVGGAMPTDLSQCLVFESHTVTRLQHRIKELEHEKSLQKKQQKESKKKHVQLMKDRRLFEAKIGEMEEKCHQMMLLKFGRIVDLEKLETVTVNRALEELKEKLRVTEGMCASEVEKYENYIQELKDQITNLTRENTNRLQQLDMLLGERHHLEGELDSRQKSLGGEFSGNRKTDVHERQRLVQLVQLQAQEVEALKDEITLLSRKGGHILPPAQPPLPPGN